MDLTSVYLQIADHNNRNPQNPPKNQSFQLTIRSLPVQLNEISKQSVRYRPLEQYSSFYLLPLLSIPSLHAQTIERDHCLNELHTKNRFNRNSLCLVGEKFD